MVSKSATPCCRERPALASVRPRKRRRSRAPTGRRNLRRTVQNTRFPLIPFEAPSNTHRNPDEASPGQHDSTPGSPSHQHAPVPEDRQGANQNHSAIRQRRAYVPRVRDDPCARTASGSVAYRCRPRRARFRPSAASLELKIALKNCPSRRWANWLAGWKRFTSGAHTPASWKLVETRARGCTSWRDNGEYSGPHPGRGMQVFEIEQRALALICRKSLVLSKGRAYRRSEQCFAASRIIRAARNGFQPSVSPLYSWASR